MHLVTGSWDTSVYGGSLVVTGYGLSATVAFTVNLANNQNAYEQQICSYQCSPQAGGKGDPHFTGFEGSRFDFNGVEGNSYELLSTANTLFNIQMVKRGFLTGEDGTRYLLPQYNNTATWIGAVGILHSGAEVLISKNEQEEASGGLFIMQVQMPPNFSRRLDVSVERTPETPEEAEGIIGRTMANLLTGTLLDADITDTVWLVEGDNKMTHSKTLEARLTSAYQTSGLFSSNARMTNFDSTAFGKVAMQPVSVSRRKLLR
ncbi:hypothetical protein WJX74_004719 [Apatococcus lobatus]|uniref:Uncharacterized protein n=1 Tax=Apatococcus lobatus TaxID=904363 RepID=A0AAW1QCW4_9CHLO